MTKNQRGLPVVSSGTEPQASPPGIAVLGKGFRPFFLAAAVHAVLVVPAWLLSLSGFVSVPGQLDAVLWHGHEMLFGFTLAVVAGFLLTAVGNWTGRETATGGWLLALVVVWSLGRISALVPGLPAVALAVIELAFIPALVWTLARPLIGTSNRRNYAFLAMLTVLWIADGAFFAELLLGCEGAARWGFTLASNVYVVMMVFVAGRVVPMFTRNWTEDQNIVGYPLLDNITVAVVVLAVLFEAAPLPVELVSPFVGIAAFLTALRTIRWRNRAMWRAPLLWILHLAYLWIPLGLATKALAVAWPDAGAMALHALTIGAIGGLTLGMMARVSLGHTGRKLMVPPLVVVAFVLVLAAALTRFIGRLLPVQWYLGSVVLAGLAFSAAFALFLLGYFRILTAPRVDGRSG